MNWLKVLLSMPVFSVLRLWEYNVISNVNTRTLKPSRWYRLLLNGKKMALLNVIIALTIVFQSLSVYQIKM
jgi:hypothetical protein